MNFEQRMIAHNMNLDYQTISDYEHQTDRTLNRIMNKFVADYKDYFDTHTFVLEYQDNIFGVLTYYILKNIQGVYSFDLKVYGKIKKTKKLFYNKKDIIKKWKLKQLTNTIKINCFNPLYYVEFDEKDFNDLSNSISIIERFTPIQLQHLCNFFNIKKEENIEIAESAINIKQFYITLLFLNSYRHSSLKSIYKEKYSNPIPGLCKYYLTGTEEDFSIFDRILKEEGNTINFYYCPEDKEKWVKDNLNYYINSRNAAQKGINLNLPDEEFEKIIEQREAYLNENVHS